MRQNRRNDDARRLAVGLAMMDDDDARLTRQDEQDARQWSYGFHVETPDDARQTF